MSDDDESQRDTSSSRLDDDGEDDYNGRRGRAQVLSPGGINRQLRKTHEGVFGGESAS
jgi:hypothetical protein